MLKRNGGIIMVCFLRHLVDPTGGSKATVSQVADHIEYAGRRIGFRHVGVGSDFDGMLRGPDGLDDVSDYPALIEELVGRGLSREDMGGIMGLNIIRVLSEVEDVANRGGPEADDFLFDTVDQVWTAEQRDILVSMGNERESRLEDAGK
jgi:membrane dipeptidase